MSLPTESLLKAYALLAREAELLRFVEEMNLRYSSEELFSYPAERIPGVVLRWLHCFSDLELWQEGLSGRSADADLEQALDLAAALEELGVEAIDERPCHQCDFRQRCIE